jgi:hypothetical protein
MDQAATNAIRAKIAKLLRLQQSPNANEAANAAEMVEKLCREHGLTVESINSDYDPDRDEACEAVIQTGKKSLSMPDVVLMNQVVLHYNGYFVTGWKDGTRVWRIFATKANHNQIALYFEYLRDCREKARKAATRPEWDTPAVFNRAFRLSFGAAVGKRLRQMREQEPVEMKTIAAAPGLVALTRPEMERQLSTRLAEQACPNIRTLSVRGSRSFSGSEAGRAAGNAVGLHKQTTGAATRSLRAGQ